MQRTFFVTRPAVCHDLLASILFFYYTLYCFFFNIYALRILRAKSLGRDYEPEGEYCIVMLSKHLIFLSVRSARLHPILIEYHTSIAVRPKGLKAKTGVNLYGALWS